VVVDAFKLGITDLSWGFNGNILLACSTDGDVMAMHFTPGVLGNACTENEKRLIIGNKYGKSVVDDYIKNRRMQASSNLN